VAGTEQPLVASVAASTTDNRRSSVARRSRRRACFVCSSVNSLWWVSSLFCRRCSRAKRLSCSVRCRAAAACDNSLRVSACSLAWRSSTEARAKRSQMHLKIRFGRLTSPLPLAPYFTLRLGSTVPNPLANVESRESTVDCKVARSSESIRSLGNVTALQLAYLPAQLQQHIVDTFHLKRMHRSTPSYPRFKHCAPTHRRRARLNQCPPSIHSMSHDRSLCRRKI